MASIRREIEIAVKVETAWEALRDVGAVHTRLARGFVTDVKMDGGDRLVTFADGSTVRERIVDVDDAARRVVWSAVGTAMTHHNASAQVTDDGGCTRFVWVADLLPDAVAPHIAAMIDAGLVAIRQTLESDAGY
jgi:carbon monoxide dehydrogenase subunit G